MRSCPICNLNIILDINTLKLTLIDDINLGNILYIKVCPNCKFYYSHSNNSQQDYNNYYLQFNNYKAQNYCIDKDQRCADFITEFAYQNAIETILDYGSGNGVFANLVSKKFKIDKFDIGMETNTNRYDLVVLSHVLEHIFDLHSFIKLVSNNVLDSKFLYIEVPNADYYEKFTTICPLQEINIEHINFFSKYALNKLFIHYGFCCVRLIDDYFILKNSKYYVIRGIFEKVSNNNSFELYLNDGIKKLDSYKFYLLEQYSNIYVYGCGQFLFKIFRNIIDKSNVVNIIDDNPCYVNKSMQNIKIINFETFTNQCNYGDNVLLTTIIHDQIIIEKLLSLNKNINIISLF